MKPCRKTQPWTWPLTLGLGTSGLGFSTSALALQALILALQALILAISEFNPIEFPINKICMLDAFFGSRVSLNRVDVFQPCQLECSMFFHKLLCDSVNYVNYNSTHVWHAVEMLMKCNNELWSSHFCYAACFMSTRNLSVGVSQQLLHFQCKRCLERRPDQSISLRKVEIEPNVGMYTQILLHVGEDVEEAVRARVRCAWAKFREL